MNIVAPKLLIERCMYDVSSAGFASSIYFLFRTLGAFVGSFLLVRIAAINYFRFSMMVAIFALGVLLFVQSEYLILGVIAIIGFACSSIFSIIYSMALQACPNKSNEISGLMITGVFGGAVIPPLMGITTDLIGNQLGSLFIILICTLYLMYCSSIFSSITFAKTTEK